MKIEIFSKNLFYLFFYFYENLIHSFVFILKLIQKLFLRAFTRFYVLFFPKEKMHPLCGWKEKKSASLNFFSEGKKGKREKNSFFKKKRVFSNQN